MEPIQTPRLTLRPYAGTDAGVIAGFLDDFGISKWIPTIPHPYRLADAEVFLALDIPFPERAVIVQDGALIGGVSVKSQLGYWLAPFARGQGFAGEASAALLDWFFAQSGNDEIKSGHIEGNAASGAVLAKLGFEVVGTDIVHVPARGQDMPHVTMRMTREMWEARDG